MSKKLNIPTADKPVVLRPDTSKSSDYSKHKTEINKKISNHRHQTTSE